MTIAIHCIYCILCVTIQEIISIRFSPARQRRHYFKNSIAISSLVQKTKYAIPVFLLQSSSWTCSTKGNELLYHHMSHWSHRKGHTGTEVCPVCSALVVDLLCTQCKHALASFDLSNPTRHFAFLCISL